MRARRSGLAAEGNEGKERAALVVVLMLGESCARWRKGVVVPLLLLLLLVLKLLLLVLLQARGRKKLAAKAVLGEVVARCRRLEEEASMLLTRVVSHTTWCTKLSTSAPAACGGCCVVVVGGWPYENMNQSRRVAFFSIAGIGEVGFLQAWAWTSGHAFILVLRCKIEGIEG